MKNYGFIKKEKIAMKRNGKRILSLFLTVLLCLSLLPMGALASEELVEETTAYEVEETLAQEPAEDVLEAVEEPAEEETEVMAPEETVEAEGSVEVEAAGVETAEEIPVADEETIAWDGAFSGASSASSIIVGNRVSGSITSSNYKDYYKFTLSSSGKFTLTVSTPMRYVSVRVYDADGYSLLSKTADMDTTMGENEHTYTLDLTSGTYYIGIIQYSSSNTGTYTLQTGFVSAGESFAESGSGINNTLITASAATLGKTYQGQIAVNDDVDYYKFTLSSSGKTTLTVTTPMNYIYVRVYDAEGDRLLNEIGDMDTTMGRNEHTYTLDLTSGTYYVGIVQYSSNNTGTYTLQTAFVSAGESFAEKGTGINNTLLTASAATLGKTYQGQLAANDDVDYYKFTLSSSGTITVTVATPMNYAYVRIYDADGSKLLSKTASMDTTVGKNEHTYTLDLTSGTYYVGVVRYSSSNTGTYTLTVGKKGVVYSTTGWQQKNSTWYYYDSTGQAVTGWQWLGGNWYFFRSNGAMVTGWQQIGGTWYCFKSGGAMMSSTWVQSGNSWFYLTSGGAMATGFQTINGSRYYFNSNGAMATGWTQIKGSWYYFNVHGNMKTGWQQVNGKWYLLSSSGVMQTGWKQIGSQWFYFLSGGAMATGWQKLGGNWYYFGTDGVMRQSAWLQSGGSWYYFKSSGAMAVSESIRMGGTTYKFDAKGRMV
jgi:glucan-binding YG repeat protein/Tfp pilus assembly protein PilX